MSYLNFDKSHLVNLEFSLKREILRTNRAGSYVLTTLVGCNTRKYHGLLICPMEHLDDDCHVLLSSLDETIIVNNEEFDLGIHKYPGDIYHPKGHKYIEKLEVDMIPVYTYRVGNIILKKERLFVEKEQQILIKYSIVEADSDLILRFRPFLAFRNVHQLSKSNLHANTKVKFITNGIKSRLYEGYPYLNMQFDKQVEFVVGPDWYYNFEYPEEMKRGYDFREDLFTPGYFELKAKKGDVVIFSAATFEVENPDELKKKFNSELKKRIPRTNFKNCLLNAAKQFIVHKEKKTEIIAGYPWFGSWGRDTFIALPGLTLSTGDHKICKEVLDTMTLKLKNGLFPNISSQRSPVFNSVDAPLWYIWAIQQYNKVINNPRKIWDLYSAPIMSILQNYRVGTLHNIRMRENGLICAYEPGKALTWMDAIVDGKPVTPRYGCPVEINALWYNAIMFFLELAKINRKNDLIDEWDELPERVKNSFIKNFWSQEKGYLADVVFEEKPDWTIRPNQIIAVALDYSPVDDEIRKSVIKVVEKFLLTPRGLRTLAPTDERYIGIYEGNQKERDLAYHQGTVWPWLLEHYAEAYIKAYKKNSYTVLKKIVEGFEPCMFEHGIGTISEIYDGDPPHNPRGAVSQAWSVAAILRIMEKIENLEKEQNI